MSETVCEEKPADIPFEEHFKLECENKVLREIIIELNKKILKLEKELKK